MSLPYTHTTGYGEKEVIKKTQPATASFLRKLCEVTGQQTVTHLEEND